MIKYGIFLGRFAPWHIGHQYNVDQIKADGLEPIIFKGSAQEYGTKKNPYHPIEAINMIKLANPGIRVYSLDDEDSWDDWFTKYISAIKLIVTRDLSEVTFYIHDKEEDLQDFTFKGIEYKNESYSKLYEVCGLNVVHMPISDVQIRATHIRENFEGNKHFLHPDVYEYLKNRK